MLVLSWYNSNCTQSSGIATLTNGTTSIQNISTPGRTTGPNMNANWIQRQVLFVYYLFSIYPFCFQFSSFICILFCCFILFVTIGDVGEDSSNGIENNWHKRRWQRSFSWEETKTTMDEKIIKGTPMTWNPAACSISHLRCSILVVWQWHIQQASTQRHKGSTLLNVDRKGCDQLQVLAHALLSYWIDLLAWCTLL